MVTDTPVYDEQGNLIAIIGVSTDITKIKQTEQLRRSEERFRSLVQNSSDVITVIDADGTIIYDSPAVERVLGYKPDERVGTNAFDQAHPNDLEQATRIFEEILANPGAQLTLEFPWPHKDGSLLYVEVTLTNLLEDPAVRGIVFNWRDITERKRAEETLKESEERFRLLAENAQDVIFRYRLKPTPGFEYVSPSATVMIGYTPEEHYADPAIIDKVVHPDDQHIIEQTLRHPEERIALRWLRKDGEILWTDQRNKPIYDEAGELVAIEGIVRDVTETKKAEEALKESEVRFRLLVEGVKDYAIFMLDD
jgi:PAS domain S-box-containing protein